MLIAEHDMKLPSEVLYHLPTARRYVSELNELMHASSTEEAMKTWALQKRRIQVSRILVRILMRTQCIPRSTSRHLQHATLCENWFEQHPAAVALHSTPRFSFAMFTVTAAATAVLVFLCKNRTLV